jgi:hypothetical protein
MANLGVIDRAFHSNGSSKPFVVAIVDDASDGQTKLVIMFDEPGQCAVLSLDRLIEEEDISVKSNSPRDAERYEDELRNLLWEK